jgi:hypothetical protein
MSTGEVIGILVFVFIAVFCFAIVGYISGAEAGKKIACESVKMEWVKDKCMKVTREAV